MYSVGFDVDGKPDHTLPESSSKIRPELPPFAIFPDQNREHFFDHGLLIS